MTKSLTPDNFPLRRLVAAPQRVGHPVLEIRHVPLALDNGGLLECYLRWDPTGHHWQAKEMGPVSVGVIRQHGSYQPNAAFGTTPHCIILRGVMLFFSRQPGVIGWVAGCEVALAEFGTRGRVVFLARPH